MRQSPNQPAARTWWHHERPFSPAEIIADGIVHGIGILMAVGAGSALLVIALLETAPSEFWALAIYVATLVAVLSISLAFNLWSPRSPMKRHWARLDQAAIFLFIAGTYTPFLALVGGTPMTDMLMVGVWSLALLGVALKLVVPMHFGRMAILLYLAIGWSGIAVFQSLAAALPPMALWLLLAGGIVYSLGIVFHLWSKLKFQNVLWHVFVVAGATLHLVAIFDVMVLSRL